MDVKSNRSRRTWRDPDDAPEMTAERAAKADLHDAEKLVRHGRHIGSGKQTQTTVRISTEALRMDAALKSYVASRQQAKRLT